MTVHEMLHTGTDSSGFETWECVYCPRKILLHWPPEYSRLVIEPGDENASHVGSQGGLTMNATVTPRDAT